MEDVPEADEFELVLATEMLEEVAAEELNKGISIANSGPTVQ